MTKSAEVHRILARYLVEVVERHELCPWARGARERGELAIGIVWGTPGVPGGSDPLDAWLVEAERTLAMPSVAVAMVVAPELAISRTELGALRDRLAARLPAAGIAEFHPEAALDLATPARLVPFLRRSPDPMLQLVPLALLDAVRAAPPTAVRAHQAAMLGGHAAPPRPAPSARIAGANHATAAHAHAEIAATLDAIAADRRAGYARAGIAAPGISGSR
ncbi:MAG TPA: hypothetical protein VH165_10550 [Kofleriaceae bacterium]|nr:hypothetical protein [Kofleriaceae bacterium]